MDMCVVVLTCKRNDVHTILAEVCHLQIALLSSSFQHLSHMHLKKLATPLTVYTRRVKLDQI